MLSQLKSILSRHYAPLLQKDAALVQKLLESPKAGGHGHVAMPVFAWAKEFKKAPPVLAKELAEQMGKSMPSGLLSVEALSGFVNFTFTAKFIQDLLVQEILGKKGKVGFSEAGAGKKLLI